MGEYEWNDEELGCHGSYMLPVIEALLRGLPSHSVIADVGCGNGSMLARLRQPGWELHGLDMSVSGIAQASKAYPGITFSYADLLVDMTSHPLAGKCDVVISTEVVEHVFLPRLFARNCHALLKPGGLLIISTPYNGYLKGVILAITGRMDKHYTALWDYGHIKFWSRRTLTMLLEESGFTVVRFIGLGRGIPFLWKSMILTATKK